MKGIFGIMGLKQQATIRGQRAGVRKGEKRKPEREVAFYIFAVNMLFF